MHSLSHIHKTSNQQISRNVNAESTEFWANCSLWHLAGILTAVLCEAPVKWVSVVRTLIARFMGPTWGPSEADRTQVGPMLAPWTLLSGKSYCFVIARSWNLKYWTTLQLMWCNSSPRAKFWTIHSKYTQKGCLSMNVISKKTREIYGIDY